MTVMEVINAWAKGECIEARCTIEGWKGDKKITDNEWHLINPGTKLDLHHEYRIASWKEKFMNETDTEKAIKLYVSNVSNMNIVQFGKDMCEWQKHQIEKKADDKEMK